MRRKRVRCLRCAAVRWVELLSSGAIFPVHDEVGRGLGRGERRCDGSGLVVPVTE